ncbi:hypothetical protein GF1_12670 [Desulfolithobacter dissulfuricans]|uniref:Uncharacterized protein n=1 Tax=Desulfolithobacter dissulfuricans TaxID=2795293 RepID=A0A915XKY6_9BACT|nr:hypothetical protein GF1_12670 [Desulfolithobacter dissulfuricans]
MGGHALGGQHPVTAFRQIIEGIEQCSVQIKDHSLVAHAGPPEMFVKQRWKPGSFRLQPVIHKVVKISQNLRRVHK